MRIRGKNILEGISGISAEALRLKHTWSTHQHLNAWSLTLRVIRSEGCRGPTLPFLCISSKVIYISAQSMVARRSHLALPVCKGSGTQGDHMVVELRSKFLREKPTCPYHLPPAFLQARILDGLPFHSPGYLPDPGIEPRSRISGRFFTI